MTRSLLPAILLALITAASTAQNSPQTVPDPKDWGVKLAPEPVRSEAVGVTIHVPVGSVTQQSAYERLATTSILLPEDLGTVIIQERRTKNLELETEEVADSLILGILSLTPQYGFEKDKVREPTRGKPDPNDLQVVGSGATVISRNKDMTVGGYPADHAYIDLPRVGSTISTVRGSTLVKVGPGRFILFELFTSGSPADKSTVKYDRAREMYEVMLATVTIDDPTDLSARRAAAVGMGIRVLDRLTESDYREVFSSMPERWERLYQDAATGATADEEEIGYRRVRAHIGKRGEMSPKKPKDLWNAAEQDEGFIVQIDARILDLGGIIDTRATYFATPDFEEEAWVVTMSIRKQPDERGSPGKVTRWQEIGARRGTDMSVRIVPQSADATTIHPQVATEGYISMVQSFVLPQLLVHADIPGDMAFYTYQTTSGTVRLRNDSLTQSDKGRKLWTLTTRLNTDAQPQTTTLTAEGEILRTTFTDGRRWDVIPLEQLVRIWKTKGLPLD